MNEDQPSHPSPPPPRWTLLAFPAVLWFIATFFFLGDIGRWNDDWFYVQRTPETGAIRALVLDRPIHFWRPLYRAVVPALATLLSGHTGLLHLLSAFAHALCAWMLYLLVVRLGARRLAAAAGALAFLVFPWDTEVVFWCCNLPTALSATLALTALHAAARRAIAPLGLAGAGFALTFAACCLNEQPALITLALPLVFLGTHPAAPLGRAKACRLGILLLLAPLAAIALYTGLARWVVGPMDIGAGHGLLPLTRWPATIADFLGWLTDTVGSSSWLDQAWRHAFAAAAEHPLRASLLGLALLTTIAFWVGSMARAGHERTSPDGAPHRPLWLVAIGLLITLAPLGPIIAFGYWLNPRVLYPSAVGIGFLIATALSHLASRPGAAEARGRRALVGGALALMLGAGAVAMVGIQHAYRQRDRLDHAALSAIRELVPNPAPGSVFVPARLDPPHWPSRARTFEAQFWTIFNSWWSAEPALRLAYGRSDLRCGFALWGSAAWLNPTRDSVRVDGVGRTSWENLIPFEIDDHNNVNLITTVRYTTRTGEAGIVPIPQATALASDGRIPFRIWTFPKPSPPTGRPIHPAADRP